ncbi:two-component regulator propeller domain-containing protein [uncultured Winogradskyella sp.]|uniref:ligand-binding sensor domain-containing protein n=1 Tax=uncultured Winogradskyella sp. TaxID=395353 RepID=UPI00262947C3|nr:two-component regulator propeller domain-containing protein [uncultured Winogradskyella sp.]
MKNCSNINFKSFIIVISLFIHFLAFAQNLENTYFFKSITTAEGLSNNVVFDTHQDKDGYIWFATNNGLNRYDGYSITTFFHSEKDSTSIASNVVRCLTEDFQGQLWVGTKNGLNRFNKDTQSFEKPIILKDFGLQNNQVMSMQLDKSKKIWITMGDFIGQFDPESLTVGSVKTFNSFMVDIALANENIWISNADGDIYKYNIDSKILTKKASAIPINTVHYGAHSKSLWAPADFQIKTQSLPIRYLPTLPDNANPKHFVELNAQVSWIGTNNGLFEYNYTTKKLSKISLGKSALSSQVRSIYKDPNEGVWVGTLGGVYHYDPYRKVFNHNDLVEESDDIIMALHKDENGVYANTLANGLYFKSHKAIQYKELALPKTFPKEGLFIWDLETVPENNYPLWMSTNDGIICLDPKTLDFQKLEIPLTEKDENISFSMLNSKQDFLWATTHRAIHKFRKRNGELLDSFALDDRIEYPGIQKIIALDDYIFIATEHQGLFKFHLQSSEISEVYLKDNKQVFGSSIWDLYVAKNKLWIGTNDGLYRLSSEDLLIEPVLEDTHVVFSIAEDDSGMLWLGLDNGIKSYNPNNQKTKYYTTVDGLKNIEFNRKSVVKDSIGNLWFGGVNGITSFNPELVKKDNPNIPEVHIKDLRVATSDSTFSISKFQGNITLPWRHNTIELDFVGLSYTNPLQNNYKYIMEGHDPNWVTTDKPNTARYVKLPVGTYNFKVNAANNDRIWNTEGDSLKITIIPPFWRTKIAYLLYVLSFLGLIWLFRRLKTYRKRISQVEQEKDVIAKKVEEKFIVLNSKTKVYLKDLKYIKAAGNYLEFYTLDKTLIDRNKLKLLEEQLPPNFIRTHRSYIVNKNYIISANSASVFIKPDVETPLSRRFKGSLK